MRGKTIGILLVLALLTQGCATIMNGTRQNISLGSNPPEATATIDGTLKVKTPTIISLARDKDHVVTVEKEGYESGQATINRSFNGWSTILGNILWLLPGVVVDLWAGGAWTLDPENVNVSLVEKRK